MAKNINDKLTVLKATLAERAKKKSDSVAALKAAKETAEKRISELTPAEKVSIEEFDADAFVKNNAELKALKEYVLEIDRKFEQINNAPLGVYGDAFIGKLSEIERESAEIFEDRLRKATAEIESACIEHMETMRSVGSLGSTWAPSSWSHTYFQKSASFDPSVTFLMQLKESGVIELSKHPSEW